MMLVVMGCCGEADWALLRDHPQVESRSRTPLGGLVAQVGPAREAVPGVVRHIALIPLEVAGERSSGGVPAPPLMSAPMSRHGAGAEPLVPVELLLDARGWFTSTISPGLHWSMGSTSTVCDDPVHL